MNLLRLVTHEESDHGCRTGSEQVALYKIEKAENLLRLGHYSLSQRFLPIEVIRGSSRADEHPCHCLFRIWLTK